MNPVLPVQARPCIVAQLLAVRLRMTAVLPARWIVIRAVVGWTMRILLEGRRSPMPEEVACAIISFATTKMQKSTATFW